MNESCHYLGIKKRKKERKDCFVTLQYFLNKRIYPGELTKKDLGIQRVTMKKGNLKTGWKNTF